jgi:ribosomal protein S27AE
MKCPNCGYYGLHYDDYFDRYECSDCLYTEGRR